MLTFQGPIYFLCAHISAFHQTVVLVLVLDILKWDFSVKLIWCEKDHILVPLDG